MSDPNTIAKKVIRPSTLLLALPLLHAGCVAPVDSKADEVDETTNIATSSQAVTNGDVSADPPYVVEIHHIGDSGFCTGTVISQHYILTVAHCLGRSGVQAINVWNGANAEILAYSGAVDVMIHPNWDGGAGYDAATANTTTDWAHDVPWDIALVRLRGAGLGSTCLTPWRCRSVPRVRVYAGPETPWAARGGMFSVTGYGGGTDAGGPFDCPDTSGNDGRFTKRGGSFAFSGSHVHDSDSATWLTVDGYAAIRTLCHGDSGAGWRLTRNGQDFLFAVWSGGHQVNGNFVHGDILSATMVQPKIVWIQNAAETIGLPLLCTFVRDNSTQQEVDYYDCEEQPVIVFNPGFATVQTATLSL
jgi:hypothetical protein